MIYKIAHDGAVATSSTSQLTAAIPTHAVGDLLLCSVGYKGGSNSTPSISAGWTAINSSEYGTTCGVAAWYKVAGANETDPTITLAGASTNVLCRIINLRNFDVVTQLDNSGVTGTGTGNILFSALTGNQADTVSVGVFCRAYGGGLSPASGWTNWINLYATTGTTGVALGVQARANSSTDVASGSVTASTYAWASIHFTLRPRLAPATSAPGCRFLDNVDDYIETANAMSTWTVEFWYIPRLLTTGSGQQVFNANDGTNGFNITTNTTGRLSINNAGYGSSIVDAWHHLAITVSPTQAKVYFDGTEVWQTTNSLLIPTSCKPKIGANGGNFQGSEVDCVRLWSGTVRSATEIASDMDEEVVTGASDEANYNGTSDVGGFTYVGGEVVEGGYFGPTQVTLTASPAGRTVGVPNPSHTFSALTVTAGPAARSTASPLPTFDWGQQIRIALPVSRTTGVPLPRAYANVLASALAAARSTSVPLHIGRFSGSFTGRPLPAARTTAVPLARFAWGQRIVTALPSSRLTSVPLALGILGGLSARALAAARTTGVPLPLGYFTTLRASVAPASRASSAVGPRVRNIVRASPAGRQTAALGPRLALAPIGGTARPATRSTGVPAPVGRTVGLNLSDVRWWWDGITGIDPIKGGATTFTRDSVAYFTGRRGESVKALKNTPRIEVVSGVLQDRPVGQLLLQAGTATQKETVSWDALSLSPTYHAIYGMFKVWGVPSSYPQVLMDLGGAYKLVRLDVNNIQAQMYNDTMLLQSTPWVTNSYLDGTIVRFVLSHDGYTLRLATQIGNGTPTLAASAGSVGIYYNSTAPKLTLNPPSKFMSLRIVAPVAFSNLNDPAATINEIDRLMLIPGIGLIR